MGIENSVSVLTLIRGRRKQLERLIAFLEQQTRLPDQLVIAVMEKQAPVICSAAKFPIRTVLVEGDDLPLARARNTAALHAIGENLIFLDIDCLPGPTLVETYGRFLESGKRGVAMGEVYYLPPLGDEVFHPDRAFPTLLQSGVRHPSKRAFAVGEESIEPNHGELWGLSFALSASDFFNVGRFDEGFYGYGGEETDFARALRENRIDLYRLDRAEAYHQHHVVSIPPLQHFDGIVRNATRYHSKWDEWCMDYWLGQFVEMGLIAWTPDASGITVHRPPTSDEIEAAIKDSTVLFS